MAQHARKRTPAKSSTRRGRSSRSKRTPSKRSAAAKPNALRLLKEDHDRVKALFERFERTRGDQQKEKLAETICEELKVHAQLEEEIFYPAVREEIEDDDLMAEAEVEHTSAKELIAKIEASSPSDEKFDALVTVLGEYVKHHIKEEESEMFKKVRQSELDLAGLGDRMKERKRSLQGGPATRAMGRLASMVDTATGA
jgi:hemerythrin-like domain-containing protein